MRQLDNERFYLYRASTESPLTVRLTMHMDGKVDGQMLREAVDATRLRYPYLCVSLKTFRNADGHEVAEFDDNPLPWVVTARRKPVELLGSEANQHLMAFAWWDDCIAFDFFHAIIDGEGAYRVLRTLLYEYCRRRYDSNLSREGVWIAGDEIDPAEMTDPATLEMPHNLSPQPVPPPPPAIDLSTCTVAPMAETSESIHILADEEQVMHRVRSCHGTPTVWLSLLMAQAIACLHPDSATAVPVITVPVNMRKALNVPLTHHSLVGGLFLPLSKELQDKSMEEQIARFRALVACQTCADNIQAYFWQKKQWIDSLEQLPTLEARYQALARVNDMARQMGSCTLSYVGKANLGAAERYVLDLRTEADSPNIVTTEISAVNGKFCISFMHQLATDAYLDAFLDQLRSQDISYEIAERHQRELPPIRNFRNITE